MAVRIQDTDVGRLCVTIGWSVDATRGGDA